MKQTLQTLFNGNLLPAEEIKCLQDSRYCKKTLGIEFPLLQKDWTNCVVKGHSRYWGNSPAKKIGGFYVCSQWWKAKSSEYDEKIAEWLISLEKASERQIPKENI